jgi:hypothetical protein
LELIVPWFAFWPRVSRHTAGVLLASFQIFLIVRRNLSFLNWLTLVPCLACLDDTFWARVLPGALVRRAQQAAAEARDSRTARAGGARSRGCDRLAEHRAL